MPHILLNWNKHYSILGYLACWLDRSIRTKPWEAITNRCTRFGPPSRRLLGALGVKQTPCRVSKRVSSIVIPVLLLSRRPCLALISSESPSLRVFVSGTAIEREFIAQLLQNNRSWTRMNCHDTIPASVHYVISLDNNTDIYRNNNPDRMIFDCFNNTSILFISPLDYSCLLINNY